MSLEFPAFALPEEHVALRESVRALAEDKIAPRTAEVDRTAEPRLDDEPSHPDQVGSRPHQG